MTQENAFQSFSFIPYRQDKPNSRHEVLLLKAIVGVQGFQGPILIYTGLDE